MFSVVYKIFYVVKWHGQKLGDIVKNRKFFKKTLNTYCVKLSAQFSSTMLNVYGVGKTIDSYIVCVRPKKCTGAPFERHRPAIIVASSSHDELADNNRLHLNAKMRGFSVAITFVFRSCVALGNRSMSVA